MAASPMLGLAALLCLSVPRASCLVRFRRPVQVALLEPQGRDCSHIWAGSPGAPSGVYTVQPAGAATPFQVLCDMHPDGGWTVIQSRDWGRGRPLDFERCWQEYKQGFGDLRGDHWLGLQHISDLTSQPGLRAELRVDLLDVDNRTLHAHYDHFHVDGEAQFYRLSLGLYSGNAGERFGGEGPGGLRKGQSCRRARAGREGWVPRHPSFPAHTCQSLCLGKHLLPEAPALGSPTARQQVWRGGRLASTHAATTRRGRVPGLRPHGQPGGLRLQHARPRPRPLLALQGRRPDLRQLQPRSLRLRVVVQRLRPR
ncbi:unnamed protein product [Nyctereutes procyonoides]|uniref:(raccoon dog) hypothetical protein n=1 Tax=Nyctereutes procyonoides TaxID=34880 RepID=A0A811YHF2_NYCPR|nr:angiopoietin-2-like isoform X2 [Nyctereutes procyonoides]CAD7676990.1 unnamed protein product [Nyctereutes procyonoides]